MPVNPPRRGKSLDLNDALRQVKKRRHKIMKDPYGLNPRIFPDVEKDAPWVNAGPDAYPRRRRRRR